MKKAFFIFLAIIMIGGGVYGVYQFSGLHRAETEINRAILNINEEKYAEAVEILKEVLSNYEYRIVRAPALNLLAQTYEHTGAYRSAENIYNSIISDPSLKDIDNWWASSVISLTKLYRKGKLRTSVSQKEQLVRSIDGFIEDIEQKDRFEDQQDFLQAVKRFFTAMLTFNFQIDVEIPSDATVIRGLKIELGYLLLEIGEYGRAEEVLSSVDSPVSKLGLAKLYLEMGEHQKGIEILKGLLTYDYTGNIKKYYIKELFDYAEALYSKGLYHEALMLYEEVDRIAPDTVYSELSLYRLSKHYFDSHENSKSFRTIEKLLNNSITLKDQEALLIKGYMYYDRREFVKALKVFNEFLKLYPKSKLYGTAREWKAMTERSIKYVG